MIVIAPYAAPIPGSIRIGLGDAGQTATTATAGGGAIATALVPASMVPIVGAAVAGVTLALSLIFSRKGPQQRIASTAIVNDLEPQLQANLAAYMAGPRTKSSQAQALLNFDQAWQFLQSADGCGAPALGAPGKACIDDRKAGACKWKDDADECWNWFIGYRDPIANDDAAPDPTVMDTTGGMFDSIGASLNNLLPTGSNRTPYLIAAGALLLIAMLPSD